MFLKLKVHCTCGCCYYINEKISVDKITCPNCRTNNIAMSVIDNFRIVRTFFFGRNRFHRGLYNLYSLLSQFVNENLVLPFNIFLVFFQLLNR